MEPRHFDELILTINAQGMIQATLTTYNNIRETVSGVVSKDEYLIDDIRSGVTDLNSGRLENRPKDIRRLGRDLFRAIFPEKIGELFHRAYQKVRMDYNNDRARWLRVVIETDEEAEAHKWPLEFLFSQEDGIFLASEKPAIAFSRRSRLDIPFDQNRLEPKDPPIRVLLVISKPPKLAGVISSVVLNDINQWINVVSEGDEENNERKIDVRVLGRVDDFERQQGIDYGFAFLDEPATWKNLHTLMASSEWLPDVLHFIGHGKYESDSREGSLALCRVDNDEAEWCSSSDLKHLFTQYQPWLVLLQACEGAFSGTEPGFMSMADQMFRLGIPAVVAMQFSITNKFASLFAEGFYEALRKGKDIDEAVQEGRYKITTEGKWSERHFGSPVLFTYYPGSILKIPGPVVGKRPIKSVVTKTAPAPGFDPLQRVVDKVNAAQDQLDESPPDLDSARTSLTIAGNNLERCAIAQSALVRANIAQALESLAVPYYSPEEAAGEAGMFLNKIKEILASCMTTGAPVRPLSQGAGPRGAVAGAGVQGWQTPKIPETPPGKVNANDQD